MTLGPALDPKQSAAGHSGPLAREEREARSAKREARSAKREARSRLPGSARWRETTEFEGDAPDEEDSDPEGSLDLASAAPRALCAVGSQGRQARPARDPAPCSLDCITWEGFAERLFPQRAFLSKVPDLRSSDQSVQWGPPPLVSTRSLQSHRVALLRFWLVSRRRAHEP